MKGEVFLFMNTPFFKTRYSVSTNFFVGCRVSCEFCYYKMSEKTEPYFRKSSTLHQVADAKTFFNVLEYTDIVPSNVPVMVCASSDYSMPENKKEFLKYINEEKPKHQKKFFYFLLRRPPWTKEDAKPLLNHNDVIFSTTITPLAYEKSYNKIKDNTQIKGLLSLREIGIDKRRISIEVGPIFPENISAVIKTLHFLYEMDIVEFLTIRGVSLGTLDKVGDETVETLIKSGFISREEFNRLKNSYTYKTENKEISHTFYVIKNYLNEAIERKMMENKPENLAVYRNTAHLYVNEFDVDIAINRNNKTREELVKYANKEPLTDLQKKQLYELVEKLTGQTPEDIEEENEEIKIKGVYATEDIAHTIGRKFRKSVLFERFSNQPTIEDLNTLPAYTQILEICKKIKPNLV